MTWGEIQIISLQKMFAKDEPINVKDLEKLKEDDDISQATAYRNEFEVGLQDLIGNIENQSTIVEVY